MKSKRTKACEISPKVREEVEKRDGICMAAHIDREKNGIVATLGCVPDYLDFKTLEISRKAVDFKMEEKYQYITDSDAHTLTNISEKVNFLDIAEITVDEIIKKLK